MSYTLTDEQRERAAALWQECAFDWMRVGELVHELIRLRDESDPSRPAASGSVTYQVTRAALRQLWAILEAENQTEAVQKLWALVDAAGRKRGVPPSLEKRLGEGYRMGLSDTAFHIGYQAAEKGTPLVDAQEELRAKLEGR